MNPKGISYCIIKDPGYILQINQVLSSPRRGNENWSDDTSSIISWRVWHGTYAWDTATILTTSLREGIFVHAWKCWRWVPRGSRPWRESLVKAWEGWWRVPRRTRPWWEGLAHSAFQTRINWWWKPRGTRTWWEGGAQVMMRSRKNWRRASSRWEG